MTINFRVGHIESAENDSWILNEEHFSAARFYQHRHSLCVNVHRFNALSLLRGGRGGGGGGFKRFPSNNLFDREYLYSFVLILRKAIFSVDKLIIYDGCQIKRTGEGYRGSTRNTTDHERDV